MIGKFIDYVGFENLLSYLIEVGDFYFKPKQFFKTFSKKLLKEKLIQIFFYAILIIGLGFVLISDTTVKKLVKALLYEIGALFWIIIVLLLSEFLISRFRRKKPELESIIFFPILVKLLLAPFQLIFFGLFITYENYNYFFLSNLVILLLTLYILIGSGYIFYSKKRFICLFIISNLILINIIHFALTALSLDNYSTYEYPYVDVIMKERFEKAENLSEFYTTPQYKVLEIYEDNNALVYYLLSNPFDSIATGSVDHFIEYKSNIRNDIKILDTLELNYTRNKKFYGDIENLYKKIDSLTNFNDVIDLNKIKPKEIEEASIIIDKDSTELYKQYILNISPSISVLNYKLIENEIELENLSSNSAIPFRFLEFLYPFAKFYKNPKTHPNGYHK